MGCGCTSEEDQPQVNQREQETQPNSPSSHRRASSEDEEKGTKKSVAPFENGGPEMDKYDEIYGCFREEEEVSDLDDDPETRRKKRIERRKRNAKIKPGKLYRLVQKDSKTWYFYNDTKEYNMVVTGYFGPMNELTAEGKTRMWREMPSGLVIAELVVEPLDTLPFVRGNVSDGFDLRFKALPYRKKKKNREKGGRRSSTRKKRRYSSDEDEEDEEDPGF